MTKSAEIQRTVLTLLSDGAQHTVQEMKATLAQDGISEYTEGQFAGSLNTLIRNGSIKKNNRGIYSIETRSEKMMTCFVVSPIGEDGSPTRANADKLFKYIIKPVCEECGFDAIRVDQLNDANSITQTIINKLDHAELVIADLTEHNPNVFFEMGYRAQTQKPIIHLKCKNERIPFDIAGIRAFDYDLGDLDSVEEIKSRLIKTIGALSFDTKSDQNNEDDSDTKEMNGDISQLIPILYEIQDDISQLKKEIHNKDTETIQAVIKAATPSAPIEDSNTAIMKAVLPELLRNPNSMKTLIELSELGNKKK